MKSPTSTSPDVMHGLDPADLLRRGAEDTIGQPFLAPSLEELSPLFPQLEMLELIGNGGMGAVYKVRQRELDRIVALKILPPAIGADPSFSERFTREAKALAKLNHPGIVTVHEFGRAGDLYFILMEFVDGMNLRQLLENGRISPREALAIVPQICDALQFAHDRGIVHRDIKPENLLLDRLGRVKVADFGLAKLVDGERTVSDEGKVMGTPNYMAPEQIAAPDEVDHRADIYALGVVFYQMLTGELPGKEIEMPSSKVKIDVRLDEVVLRALEKNPELRFQQASVMKTRVEDLGEPMPAGARNDRFRRLGMPAILTMIAGGIAILFAVWPVAERPDRVQQATQFFVHSSGLKPETPAALRKIAGRYPGIATLNSSGDRGEWWLSVVTENQKQTAEISGKLLQEMQEQVGEAMQINGQRTISSLSMGSFTSIRAKPLLAGTLALTLGLVALGFGSPARPGRFARAGDLSIAVLLVTLLGTAIAKVFFPGTPVLGLAGKVGFSFALVLGFIGWSSWKGRAVALLGVSLIAISVFLIPWHLMGFPQEFPLGKKSSWLQSRPTSVTVYVPSPAQEEKHETGEAEKWLQGIDRGDYSGSWKQSASVFQDAITDPQWVKALEAFRKPLGEVKTRTLSVSRTETQIPGMPDGEYQIMEFNTEFSLKKHSVERVTLMKEIDGFWRVAGYYIR